MLSRLAVTVSQQGATCYSLNCPRWSGDTSWIPAFSCDSDTGYPSRRFCWQYQPCETCFPASLLHTDRLEGHTQCGVGYQVCRAKPTDRQVKIKREDVIRSSHKLDLVNLKRNLRHVKLGKRTFLKKATCSDSVSGVVGVRFTVLRHWICQKIGKMF